MKTISFLAITLLIAQVSSNPADHADTQQHLLSLTTNANEGRKLVVGGADAPPGRFPYYSMLDVESSSGFHFCGAVLIHDDILLTTAKCVEGALSLYVAVNYTVDTKQPTGFEHFREITRYRAHEQFNSTTRDYNIAIMKTDQPVSEVTPVTRGSGRPRNGDSVTAIGFGRLSEGTDFPTLLQEVEVQIIPFATCNSASSYNGQIRNIRMICATAFAKVGTYCGWFKIHLACSSGSIVGHLRRRCGRSTSRERPNRIR